ncbi:MAG: phosphorylase [Brachymonas sp.]|nr:phosphorylase [Brachymonas sp.]
MTNSELIKEVDARSASALASGALVPVQAEQDTVEQDGMRFVVRWVSSLAAKDASAGVAVPGGPRDPNFNPFLHPEPALTVGALGDTHVAILNKFPLSQQHLVLATKVFEDQLMPINQADFMALARVMTEAGGMGLYNGGKVAGASQRHKHLQWIPGTPDNASLAIYLPGLPQDLPLQGLATHPKLPMRHCFVRVDCTTGMPVEQAAEQLTQAWAHGTQTLGLQAGADGLVPPYNMLISHGWMLLVPRSQERYESISIASICFGGTIYTRHREQLDVVRKAGPLQALAAVGFPA